MSPELFDGIQFGERFQAQPFAMVAEGLTGESAAMGRQSIPEQNHRATAVTLQVVQEAHDVPTANPSTMQGRQPAGAPAVHSALEAGHHCGALLEICTAEDYSRGVRWSQPGRA
jgi:hypothetical protein